METKFSSDNVSYDLKRFAGIKRDYTEQDVEKLKGTFNIEYSLCKNLSQKLWKLLNSEAYIKTLGSLSGNQAVQHAKAGLKAIYLSGWQVAADANSAGEMYPDQSLYPSDSAPKLVEAMNNALIRADQIQHMEIIEGKIDKKNKVDYQMPIIADGEAGFGGPLNVFELTKKFIKAGAAGVHFEDQLASEKKCGHMGGKVLVSTQDAINKLIAARLSADVMNVPTLLIARTDANAANLLQSDADQRDHKFLSGERTEDGFFSAKPGIEQAIDRSLSYAPYADLLWFETSKPDLSEAERFSKEIHEQFPGKILAYNCSPSFNWQANLSEGELREFRERIASMGFKFQFVTLAGWHALNLIMFELSQEYLKDGMYAYSKMQEREIANEPNGFRATKHQSFVGTGYFDAVQTAITSGLSSTTAMQGSTEEEQFD